MKRLNYKVNKPKIKDPLKKIIADILYSKLNIIMDGRQGNRLFINPEMIKAFEKACKGLTPEENALLENSGRIIMNKLILEKIKNEWSRPGSIYLWI